MTLYMTWFQRASIGNWHVSIVPFDIVYMGFLNTPYIRKKKKKKKKKAQNTSKINIKKRSNEGPTLKNKPKMSKFNSGYAVQL
jgi:hypothetical protein